MLSTNVSFRECEFGKNTWHVLKLDLMEYCEKVIEGFTVHTLNDILVQLGDCMPIELRLLAMCDVAEGLSYLHSQGTVHGDIKPHNVLVSGKSEGDYNFKITDYSGISSGVISQLSSRSSSLKQFMTPGYLAPELISDVGDRFPPNKPSDIFIWDSNVQSLFLY